jgi:hypothetical protein
MPRIDWQEGVGAETKKKAAVIDELLQRCQAFKAHAAKVVGRWPHRLYIAGGT